MNVILQPSNTTIKLVSTKILGVGGEAEVYDIGNGQVFKRFKPPNHPDFTTQKERNSAELKIQEHKKKLLDFPRGFPANIIAPKELGFDFKGELVGYSMDMAQGEVLLRYGQRGFVEKLPDVHNELLGMLKVLHGIVTSAHHAGAVIGDFNDLNVLVNRDSCVLIDADSMQFGSYLCRMFTSTFVDPLHCDPNELTLVKAHSPTSDWYAFTVMVMQTLLWVGPYGGVYKPKNPADRVTAVKRPLSRISVFHEDVLYPKPARDLKSLPDDVLHYLENVFNKDQRGEFPLQMLNNLRWQTCMKCGLHHASTYCPTCVKTAPAHVASHTQIHGTVTAERVFYALGQILKVNGTNILYKVGNALMRERGIVAWPALTNPKAKVRLLREDTLIGSHGRLARVNNGKILQSWNIDTMHGYPCFDVIEDKIFYARGGDIYKYQNEKETFVGSVLQNQTWFWAGPVFSFAYYQVGATYDAMCWTTAGAGLLSIKDFPRIYGQLVDIKCCLSATLAWVSFETVYNGVAQRTITVLSQRGEIKLHEVTQDPDHWSVTLGQGVAIGPMLLVPTDSGIKRIVLDNANGIVITDFPDTAKFVDSSMHLSSGQGGILVSDMTSVTKLSIKEK